MNVVEWTVFGAPVVSDILSSVLYLDPDSDLSHEERKSLILTKLKTTTDRYYHKLRTHEGSMRAAAKASRSPLSTADFYKLLPVRINSWKHVMFVLESASNRLQGLAPPFVPCGSLEALFEPGQHYCLSQMEKLRRRIDLNREWMSEVQLRHVKDLIIRFSTAYLAYGGQLTEEWQQYVDNARSLVPEAPGIAASVLHPLNPKQESKHE